MHGTFLAWVITWNLIGGVMPKEPAQANSAVWTGVNAVEYCGVFEGKLLGGNNNDSGHAFKITIVSEANDGTFGCRSF